MDNTEKTGSSISNEQPGNLAAVCGLYCGSCGIYLATKDNDTERLIQYAIVLNQTFDETLCDGCRAARRSAHCAKICLFMDCAFNNGVEFCGACQRFPCKELTDFQKKMPHRVEIVASLNRLNEISTEQWLAEMKENYSCPKCDSVNSAYDISCRKCGHTPSCRFVDIHKDLINDHLTND